MCKIRLCQKLNLAQLNTLSRTVGWDETTSNPSYNIAMRTYTRIRLAGGWYFFTVNLAVRRGNDLLVRRIADLRSAFRQTRCDPPFSLDVIVKWFTSERFSVIS